MSVDANPWAPWAVGWGPWRARVQAAHIQGHPRSPGPGNPDPACKACLLFAADRGGSQGEREGGGEETEKERGRKKRFASKPARLVQFLLGEQRLLGLTDQITFSTALHMNIRLLIHFPV